MIQPASLFDTRSGPKQYFQVMGKIKYTSNQNTLWVRLCKWIATGFLRVRNKGLLGYNHLSKIRCCIQTYYYLNYRH